MNVGCPRARDNDGLAHRGVPLEGVLDLPRLDPKPADFDLAIDPAEVFEIAVGSPSGEVSRAIEASAGLLAEWVWDEPFCRQAGPVEISRATPAPPMYSSPGTPMGMGSRFRFRT